MRKPVLEYSFFPNYYIAKKEVYKNWLCESINLSKKFTNSYGNNFELIKEQSNGQADVISKDTNYEIDFKLMISNTLKEFLSLSAPIIEEIAPGVKIYSQPRQIEQKAVLLQNSCRDINKDKLEKLRKRNDVESKEVIHFFDKVLNKSKNILLLIPLYITTIDKNLSPDEQLKTVFSELSDTLQYIYEFRCEKQPNYDTFLFYILNIPQNRKFYLVMSKFSSSGLILIDSISFFSLKSIISISEYNML